MSTTTPTTSDAAAALDRCLSVRELARYWRVGPRKVRLLIRRGLLAAIDLGMGGRRRVRLTPEAIRECERRLTVTRTRRRRSSPEIDPEIARLLDV